MTTLMLNVIRSVGSVISSVLCFNWGFLADFNAWLECCCFCLSYNGAASKGLLQQVWPCVAYIACICSLPPLSPTCFNYSIFPLFILPDLTDHCCSWTIDTPVDELVMRMQCCDDMTICIQHVRRRACFRQHLWTHGLASWLICAVVSWSLQTDLFLVRLLPRYYFVSYLI